jgi:hypothetical protein
MRAVLDTHCLCAHSSMPTTYARLIRYTLLMRAILNTQCAISDISSIRAEYQMHAAHVRSVNTQSVSHPILHRGFCMIICYLSRQPIILLWVVQFEHVDSSFPSTQTDKGQDGPRLHQNGTETTKCDSKCIR